MISTIEIETKYSVKEEFTKFDLRLTEDVLYIKIDLIFLQLPKYRLK